MFYLARLAHLGVRYGRPERGSFRHIVGVNVFVGLLVVGFEEFVVIAEVGLLYVSVREGAVAEEGRCSGVYLALFAVKRISRGEDDRVVSSAISMVVMWALVVSTSSQACGCPEDLLWFRFREESVPQSLAPPHASRARDSNMLVRTRAKPYMGMPNDRGRAHVNCNIDVLSVCEVCALSAQRSEQRHT